MSTIPKDEWRKYLSAIMAPLHRDYPVNFGLKLKREKRQGRKGTQTTKFGRNIGLKLGVAVQLNER